MTICEWGSWIMMNLRGGVEKKIEMKKKKTVSKLIQIKYTNQHKYKVVFVLFITGVKGNRNVLHLFHFFTKSFWWRNAQSSFFYGKAILSYGICLNVSFSKITIMSSDIMDDIARFCHFTLQNGHFVFVFSLFLCIFRDMRLNFILFSPAW